VESSSHGGHCVVGGGENLVTLFKRRKSVDKEQISAKCHMCVLKIIVPKVTLTGLFKFF